MVLSDCYYVGTITKTHGLKGHVLVKLDTDEPSSYYNMESVFIDLNGQPIPFFIQEIEPVQTDVLKVLFKDVATESLVGKDVYLPLSTLPKLSGKQFYYHEVIGFDIVQNDTIIGNIIEINDHSAQAFFVVIQENTTELAIPIINEWIVEVNREDKYISMQLPDGILDL